MIIYWRIIKRIFLQLKKAIKEEKRRLKGKNGAVSDSFRGFRTKYPFLISQFKKICTQMNGIRPQYLWGILNGADLAKELKITHISVIEFGVAGGNGLVCLERIASRIEALFGVIINIYGFDTGMGLPKPKDYRDLPYLWKERSFPMDIDRLQDKLQVSKLILGEVKDNISSFIEAKPHPIAFMAFDMDLYTSTMDAFRLLVADEGLFLPRVHCYFDEVTGYSFGDFNGERLAIADFNKTHELRKISRIYGLKYYLGTDLPWMEKMYLFHIFTHRLYNKNDGILQNSELPLEE